MGPSLVRTSLTHSHMSSTYRASPRREASFLAPYLVQQICKRQKNKQRVGQSREGQGPEEKSACVAGFVTLNV